MNAVYVTPYPEWADRFLDALREHKLLARAAKAVGTTQRHVERICEENVEFGYAVEAALEDIADYYEDAARKRAVEGTDKGVYYEGVLVATEKQYSDTLLGKFLEAKRRRQFGNKTEVTGAGGQPLIVEVRTFAPIVATILPTLPGAARIDTPLDEITVDDLL